MPKQRRRLTFICGACGVGKSSILPYLRHFLPRDKFVVLDFDRREAGDQPWLASLREWIKEASAEGRPAVEWIVGGPSYIEPDMIQNIPEASLVEIHLVLLDASEATVRGRLLTRYREEGRLKEGELVAGIPINDFIEENVAFGKQIHSTAQQHGYVVFDADEPSPMELADRVAAYIMSREPR